MRSLIRRLALAVAVLLVTEGCGPLDSSLPQVAVRVFNCDDQGRALLNGALVVSTGFGQDSGWVDLTSHLRSGTNEVIFLVINDIGAITYGFQVQQDGQIVFQEVCGTAFVVGCENNRTFPVGVARQFTFSIR